MHKPSLFSEMRRSVYEMESGSQETKCKCVGKHHLRMQACLLEYRINVSLSATCQSVGGIIT